MRLYVMRHGPAEDESSTGRDADRVLTPAGRDRVRDVARLLASAKEVPTTLLTSPLVRALQTAEIVASVTDKTLTVRRELAPGKQPRDLIAEFVDSESARVMIVGHEPDLSILVEGLVGSVLPEGMLKAMVVGITLTPSIPGSSVEGETFSSQLDFVLHPKKRILIRS